MHVYTVAVKQPRSSLQRIQLTIQFLRLGSNNYSMAMSREPHLERADQAQTRETNLTSEETDVAHPRQHEGKAAADMPDSFSVQTTQYEQQYEWRRVKWQRNDLRQQLFTAKHNLDTYKTNDLLVSLWPTYIHLNFVLFDPGPYLAVAELRQMVTNCQTPNFSYTRHKDKVIIPSRKLSHLESAKLQELLPTYETKPKAIFKQYQENVQSHTCMLCEIACTRS